MKKAIALLLALTMVFTLAACSTGTKDGETLTAANIKIGVVMIGDKSDMGYNYNHVVGIEQMQEDLGITAEQIIYKANISESSAAETALRELCESGCNIIFANSFGFEEYMLEVAKDFPEVQFCHATGYKSATDDATNTHNYFASIHEARYLAGIAAGLKTKNNHLGYVGAKAFAEVISGFTAFYLGAKSVNPDVVMDVMYTNEWSNAPLEAQAAQALIDGGCDVIGQHSDTTAPATTAEKNGVWQVGYNADMIDAAPKASLISPRIAWGIYYSYAVKTLLEGGEIDQDWSRGLSDKAVFLSPLNTAIAAEGTQAAIDKASAGLIDGTLHVFAGPLSGKGTDFNGDATEVNIPADDYFHEGETSSAPAWNYIIPGITVIK